MQSQGSSKNLAEGLQNWSTGLQIGAHRGESRPGPFQGPSGAAKKHFECNGAAPWAPWDWSGKGDAATAVRAPNDGMDLLLAHQRALTYVPPLQDGLALGSAEPTLCYAIVLPGR